MPSSTTGRASSRPVRDRSGRRAIRIEPRRSTRAARFEEKRARRRRSASRRRRSPVLGADIHRPMVWGGHPHRSALPPCSRTAALGIVHHLARRANPCTNRRASAEGAHAGTGGRGRSVFGPCPPNVAVHTRLRLADTTEVGSTHLFPAKSGVVGRGQQRTLTSRRPPGTRLGRPWARIREGGEISPLGT
jgi:hypothetical protein